MGVAWLLMFVALGGVVAGLFLGHARGLSIHLAAAGGALLFGISLFWLLPEIAVIAGRRLGLLMALAVAGVLAILDGAFVHSDQARERGLMTPLLLAAAMHSLLDGWSVRALAARPLTEFAVPLALALHKIPEGIALGWVTRRAFSSLWLAGAAATAVELCTPAGAWLQPVANQSGTAKFGGEWTAAVLAVIAGSFLFLGVHAVIPHRRNMGVVAIFVATLLVVGTTGLLSR
jgi:hypothetical protein